jgi:thiosulfate dehydrogenase [quinone] large subunit
MLKNVHDSLKFPAGKSQIFILVLLRMAIGWHLLYEGVSKLLMPDWTSAGYLERANWLFADFFHWIAGTPNVLYGVDLLNMWGLSLIGIALVIGCLTRFSGICGILLIALYYIANPPFIASGFGLPSEGHYLVVNKNLVEIIALGLVVIFPAGKFWALDTILSALLRRIPYQPVPKAETRESESGDASARLSRRQILESLASLPVLGIFAFLVSKKKQLEQSPRHYRRYHTGYQQDAQRFKRHSAHGQSGKIPGQSYHSGRQFDRGMGSCAGPDLCVIPV